LAPFTVLDTIPQLTEIDVIGVKPDLTKDTQFLEDVGQLVDVDPRQPHDHRRKE